MRIMLLAALFVLAFTFDASARRGIPIPYGESDEIELLQELPDTEAFQLQDGSYFDLGKMYTIDHIVFLAYSNTEPQIVGCMPGVDDTYIELTDEEIAFIVEESGVTLPDTLEASFFHRIGGKVILGLLILIIAYSLLSGFFKKDKDETSTEAA